jgi:hypothetical protein
VPTFVGVQGAGFTLSRIKTGSIEKRHDRRQVEKEHSPQPHSVSTQNTFKRLTELMVWICGMGFAAAANKHSEAC